ncbi:putative transcription regulator SWI/SNF-BAF60b family [Rosa chinensis]|uniref:Putative transcription regulator SWI/SNF-BAF60b family n=1 Tax=Rosa chinensis TaxID=74649 RepID=A0A2P6Q2U1_ROSCH|nr:uncharacterized protein LOC112168454 [Rosa chinensis]PRQ28491.1 putative transcription regulator SWI/SNF-BAF60b family [Rosa chinensis]
MGSNGVQLTGILSTWDLETATAASVRRHLEEDFRVHLSNTIQEQIDIFFDDGKEDENEGKGRRTRPEICTLSPQLQDFVGGGPEMARAEAMKKIVAYIREKGLQMNCNHLIFADDNLKSLFPGCIKSISMFQIHDLLSKGLQMNCKHLIFANDKLKSLFPGCTKSICMFQIHDLLSKHGHLQPLKAGKDERGVRKTNDEAICKKSENCEGDQDRVKKKGKNVTEEDVRPWDKMPQAILVKILKLLPFPDWSFHPCYVCSSWQVAVADVMFPPENRELNLLVLDSYPWIFRQRWFFKYLRIALNSPSAICWRTLYLPQTAFIKNDILSEIAEKTPELRELYVPQKLWEDVLLKSVAPKWKNLTRGHIWFGYHQVFLSPS